MPNLLLQQTGMVYSREHRRPTRGRGSASISIMSYQPIQLESMMLIQYTVVRGGGGRYRYKDHATPATSAGRHDYIPDEKGRGHCMSVYRACVLTSDC